MRKGGYTSIKTDRRGQLTSTITLHFFQRRPNSEEFNQPFRRLGEGLKTPLNINLLAPKFF
jgi:hypothetical protein